MKIQRAQIIGFRGILKGEVDLDNLTVLSGPMGTGKTSTLMAMYYGLTGRAPSNLNLDDLINVSSDFMWVGLNGEHDGKPFSLERRRRRGQASSLKADLPSIPEVGEQFLIEGREISRLFVGTPTDRGLRMDALLGLSHLHQIMSEISPASLDKRLEELGRLKDELSKGAGIEEGLSKAREEIEEVHRSLGEMDGELEKNRPVFAWAEELSKKVGEGERLSAELEGKRRLLEEHRTRLSSLPPYPEQLAEEVRELEARQSAVQRRVSFIESAMQILDLQGKKVEELGNCPLCGALTTKGALSQFAHYEEDYRQLATKAIDLDLTLREKRGLLDRAEKERVERTFLEREARRLEDELRISPSVQTSQEEIRRTRELLKLKEDLTHRRHHLEIRDKGLQMQIDMMSDIRSRVAGFTRDGLEEREGKLQGFRDMLLKVKKALADTLGEIRAEELERTRTAFRELFMRIYPYHRFSDVDFETTSIRGRESLTVKAKSKDGWLYAHQMSTGESVAMGFGLLFASRRLEGVPLLLLDEPEEGLDEEGVRGLADTLKAMSASTQIVVATRNPQLAEMLKEGRP